jgi:hypothetical protein
MYLDDQLIAELILSNPDYAITLALSYKLAQDIMEIYFK